MGQTLSRKDREQYTLHRLRSGLPELPVPTRKPIKQSVYRVAAALAFFSIPAVMLWYSRPIMPELCVGGFGLGLCLFFVICYFLPTLVASIRGHRHAAAIFVANLFLGWTFIGWVLALVWACMESRRTV